MPILGLIAGFLVVSAGAFSPANADNHDQGVGGEKVYVCKYVRTPGPGEVVQPSDNNPIEVSLRALPGYSGSLAGAIGHRFADGQLLSVVVGISPGPGGGQDGEPEIDCPPLEGPPEECPEGQVGTPPDCKIPPPKCPPGSEINAGVVIPPGQTVETFCKRDNPPPPPKCPPGSEINAGEVIPEGETVETFCETDDGGGNGGGDNGGTEDEVLGTEAEVPGPAPTAVDVPTAVDAGTESAGSAYSTTSTLLVSTGLLLLMAAAWTGIARRRSSEA